MCGLVCHGNEIERIACLFGSRGRWARPYRRGGRASLLPISPLHKGDADSVHRSPVPPTQPTMARGHTSEMSSVCPNGWRLPRTGPLDTGDATSPTWTPFKQGRAHTACPEPSPRTARLLARRLTYRREGGELFEGSLPRLRGGSAPLWLPRNACLAVFPEYCQIFTTSYTMVVP